MARQNRPSVYRRYCGKCDTVHEAFKACPRAFEKPRKQSFKRRYDASITNHFKRTVPMECAACGLTGDATFEVDHIHPIRKGGKHSQNNLQWLCQKCHRVKTNAELRERRLEDQRINRELAGKILL